MTFNKKIKEKIEALGMCYTEDSDEIIRKGNKVVQYQLKLKREITKQKKKKHNNQKVKIFPSHQEA